MTNVAVKVLILRSPPFTYFYVEIYAMVSNIQVSNSPVR